MKEFSNQSTVDHSLCVSRYIDSVNRIKVTSGDRLCVLWYMKDVYPSQSALVTKFVSHVI